MRTRNRKRFLPLCPTGNQEYRFLKHLKEVSDAAAVHLAIRQAMAKTNVDGDNEFVLQPVTLADGRRLVLVPDLHLPSARTRQLAARAARMARA